MIRECISRHKSTIFWLSISLWCSVCIGFLFADENMSCRQTVQYLLYLADFRHWPFWYSINLWIIAIVLLLNSAAKIPWARKIIFNMQKSFRAFACTFKKHGKPVVGTRAGSYFSPLTKLGFFSVVLVTVVFSTWLHALAHSLCRPVFQLMKYPLRLIYHYYFAPMTFFMIDGSVSWRLFVAPATGMFVIVLLLYLKRKFAKNHDKKRSMES